MQAVASEAESVERAIQRVFHEIRALESDMLRTLSEQTSAEKSSSKTAADIKALRAAAEAEELRIAEVQNEIARVAVDALNTQGHNERLQQALDMLDSELKEKVGLTASNSAFHRHHTLPVAALESLDVVSKHRGLGSKCQAPSQVACTQRFVPSASG